MKKMNTFCQIRRDHKVSHIMVERGLRIPVCGELIPFVTPNGGSEPVKVLYHVRAFCQRCGDGGLFDQDDNAIEYYQGKTVNTL